MPPTKFKLKLTYGLGGDVVEEFQGGHLGHPIKFKLKLTYSLGGDVV